MVILYVVVPMIPSPPTNFQFTEDTNGSFGHVILNISWDAPLGISELIN